MKKFFNIIFPAASAAIIVGVPTALAIIERPSLVTIHLNSGVGCFRNTEVDIAYQVPKGTKFSKLNVDKSPISFYSDYEPLPVVGWTVNNKFIDRSYVINSDVTLTAQYFLSYADECEFAKSKMDNSYKDNLNRIRRDYPEYEPAIVDAYNTDMYYFNQATNNYQWFAIQSASLGDFSTIFRIALQDRQEKIASLKQCRQIMSQLYAKTDDQFSITLAKTYVALYDVIGEIYDPTITQESQWFEHFMSSITKMLDSHQIYCYAGVGTLFQGHIGASKRSMIYNKYDNLKICSDMFDLYFDAIMECKNKGQAVCLGKSGATMQDAVGECYPSQYEWFRNYAIREIDEILHGDK